ncbi:MAG: RNA polymerase sigma factor [Lachnospiraceae bacterium]|nr:RNA polymerase sigma factor [Lachnospiraceae bacterium]
MEHDVWKSIYEQFYRPLYLYALSLCRNRDDAEDLVQSTFLKAFLSYEEGGSIRYWLTKVLQNEYYNLFQRRKRLVSEAGYPLDQVPDPKQEEALLAQLIAEEQKRYLFQAVMELNLTAKEVMLSSVYFGLSDEEIGRQLELTTDNVRKIRSRARKQLAQKMEERYGRE